MWRYAAAKVIGTSHTKVGQACQDRFVCSTVPSGWLIAAVADGAGSASQGEVGAEIATTASIASLAQSITEGVGNVELAIQTAMQVARARVIEEAESSSAPPRDFACTLLLIAIGPDGGAAGQIGDGLIAVKADTDDWAWVFWPQRGEYANVTRFLVDDDAPSFFETTCLRSDVFEVSVMTDGLEPLALHYASRSAHTRFFEGMIAPLREIDAEGEAAGISEQLEAFLSSDRIRARVDDDLTLLLASRLPL
jgi:hypothetical protein